MRNHVVHSLCLFAISVCVPCANAADAPAELAQKAKAILQQKCHVCHGEAGQADGGMNYVLDRNRLVKRRKIVAGKAADSVLFRQVKSGTMPKGDEPLSKDELETLKQWIDGGAIDFNPPVQPREFITNEAVLGFMQSDLQRQARADAEKLPFLRYFTITHLYNAGLSDDELQSYRVALSKLVNSLSWKKKIVVPQPIDPAQTVFRINLNDYRWTTKTWDRIVAENPYGVTSTTKTAKYCYDTTGSALPHVRADWFVSKAAVPPLYHDILELPGGDGKPGADLALEKLLQVDVAHNIKIGEAARAGFNASGVSSHNRLIERHEADLTGGAYWKSYDFGDDKGRKNLFSHPLGPSGANAFEPDGGELIFNLPNGLQAYLLVGPDGKRIDKGPIAVVSDPKRPDKQVVNGLSCMSCHAEGMKRKADEVRAAVLASQNAFTASEVTQVKQLYKPADEFEKLLDEDAARFAKAVLLTGGKPSGDEPIVTLAIRFEEELDADLVAAEAGLSTSELLTGLKKSATLSRLLPTLNAAGGTVKRDVFVASFSVVVSELQLGKYVGPKEAERVILPVDPASLKPGDLRTITVKGIETRWRWIPPGKFKMGSPIGEKERDNDEAQVDVTITKGFWMLETEVTQGLWMTVMSTTIEQQKTKATGSKVYGSGAKHPMYYVNHDEATEFCGKFNTLLKAIPEAAGLTVRLPTEAEWEYSARAGTTTRYYWGDRDEDTDQYAWHSGNSNSETQPVGQKKPNAWGLHDMSGNVWEWCSDWSADKLVGGNDPRGPSTAPLRAMRGGCWRFSVGYGHLRSAERRGDSPEDRFDYLGFRLACSSVGG